MKEKICLKCKNKKIITDFYTDKTRKDGFFPYCKECSKKHVNNQYNKNKEEKRKYQREYYKNHKLEKRRYDIEYRKKNKEKRINHEKELYYTNELYKFKKNMRNFISKSFFRTKNKKNKRTLEILGCDYLKFKKHLLQTYKQTYNVDWNNIEKVHIDHIIPLATAKTSDDVIKLCHYSNLQLLKAKDNLKKGAKLQ